VFLWDSGMADEQTFWEDVPVVERAVRDHVDVTGRSTSWARSGRSRGGRSELLRRLM
jgi:hypothetical protein